MIAREYSQALELDQVYEEADFLAQAMWLFFDAGASDEDSLTADRCIACRHFAWQLVQHVKRLHAEYVGVPGSKQGAAP